VFEPSTLLAMIQPGLEGTQAPWPWSPLVLLGLFVAIPLAVYALVILAVYGASWTRSGRTTGDYSAEPAWLSSPAASMSPPSSPGGELTAGSSESAEPGGTSARW
jgi:hypothetical protein